MRQFRLKRELECRNSNPMVKFLFNQMFEQRMTQADLAERTGFAYDTLKHWRLYTMPRVNDLEAALNAMGYEMIAVSKNRKSKKEE